MSEGKQSGNLALIVTVITALITLAGVIIVPIINNNAAQEQASRDREFELTRDALALTNDAIRTQSARDLARTETAEAVVLVVTTSLPTASVTPPPTTLPPTATETPVPPTNTSPPPTEAAASTSAPAPTQPPPPTSTSAPTSQPVVIPTQAPTDIPASFPCEATIVNPQGGTTQINNFYAEASASSSRTGRSVRIGQVINVHRRSIASDDVVWYLAYTLETDRLGWITSQYLNLSAACPSDD